MRTIIQRYPNQDKIVLGVTDENGAFYKGILVGAGGLIALGATLTLLSTRDTSRKINRDRLLAGHERY